jgi:hypothetical protein
MLAFIILFSLLLELSIYLPAAWPHRKLFASVTMLIIGFTTGVLVASRWNIIAGVIAVIAAFRVINLLRILKERMHEAYLLRAARRTSVFLGIYLLCGLLVLIYHTRVAISRYDFLYALAALQLSAALILIIITAYNIRKTRHRPALEYYSDKELPTVTIAIPARNETNDLEACLKTIIANDYPKLEILVLDDCSQDKTPEIIRGFAHDGVRFIKGAEPAERWLAKNQAYQRLYEEANGDLILFCGVDVRFGPQAIRSLVTTLLNRKKSMVSIMPRRLTNTPAAAFIQPMRYWWELALPRRFFNRPPVLSTCWLIKRDALKKCGSFAAVSHNILPERYFTRELVKQDSYSFVRADDLLDIQTAKTLDEQRATALRMRYPQIRRRPELVLPMTLAELLLLLGPFVLAFAGLIWHLGIIGWLSATAAVVLVATHVVILSVSNPPNISLAFLNLPVVILTEVFLTYESMLKYEFSVVDWKGRNICIPVMHTIPHLPNV